MCADRNREDELRALVSIESARLAKQKAESDAAMARMQVIADRIIGEVRSMLEGANSILHKGAGSVSTLKEVRSVDFGLKSEWRPSRFDPLRQTPYPWGLDYDHRNYVFHGCLLLPTPPAKRAYRTGRAQYIGFVEPGTSLKPMFHISFVVVLTWEKSWEHLTWWDRRAVEVSNKRWPGHISLVHEAILSESSELELKAMQAIKAELANDIARILA
ncbi:hypothetical protein ACWENQ_40700 [Nonomuraea sp. NPDC004354]